MAEKAESRYESLKLAFSMWESENEALRDGESIEKGEKKPTVSQMKAFVQSLPKYRGYQIKLIELREQRSVLKVLAKDFDTRANLVQTKACNRRSESK